MERPITEMRCVTPARASLPALALALALALCTPACRSGPKEPTDTPTITETEAIRDAPELGDDEASRLVRRTVRNVNQYEELRLQGLLQQMVALHRAIARTVDDNFESFRKTALEADLLLQRNMAVKCIGFAVEKKAEARDTLLVLVRDESPTIVANAVLGLGILRDPETDLAPVVELLGSGDAAVRTNAAATLANLYLIQKTPRRLTPQHYAATDRLVTMLHDETSVRGRRAAVFALANLRHPETLDHLVSALQDSDEQVQIGGLRGLQMLGDQRALEALLQYLDDVPSIEGASWARKALEQIAIQGGFAKTAAELDELGMNARLWRKWFASKR